MKNVIFIIIFTIIIVALIPLTRSELYFFPYPDIDTIYTKAFSHEKFSQVRVGMSEERVEKLLGSPFTWNSFRRAGHTQKCALYSHDNKLWPIADFAWINTGICFEDGKVISTFRSTIPD